MELRPVKKEEKIEFITDVPESFDVREQWPECKKEIRDEGPCSSSWALSAIEVLAWRFCIATSGSINLVLSVQDILSCNDNNYGCEKGYSDYTWDYLSKTGVVTESWFPYESSHGFIPPCRDSCVREEPWIKYKSTQYKEYITPSAIKDTVYKNGPIQTSFTVYSDFMQYESGIYNHVSGTLLGGHDVVIIGWGIEDGTKYWIAQNSWGKDWGEQGYFRIVEGICKFDEQGIAGEALV